MVRVSKFRKKRVSRNCLAGSIAANNPEDKASIFQSLRLVFGSFVTTGKTKLAKFPNSCWRYFVASRIEISFGFSPFSQS